MKVSTIQKIVFVGGGTLGHIFPMIPVIKQLKERNNNIKIYFIGTKSGLEKEIIKDISQIDQSYYFDMQGLKRSISIDNIKTLYKYIKCKKNIRQLFKSLKPDMVIGMGGYISGVTVKVANELKIKTIIHEQNSVMGLSNKIVSKRADLILLTYPIEELAKQTNVKVIGNPRTSEFYEKYKNKKQPVTRTILIVGGSRGADLINDISIRMYEDFHRQNIKVVLITGNKYYKNNYVMLNRIKNDNFQILPFTKDLSMYLHQASVVVTRSGATTIAEIMALRKVCLFIPSPNVTNNHQEKNARVLVDKVAALMILEKDITEARLMENILKLLDDYKLRNSIIDNIKNITNIDACDKFVHEILNLEGAKWKQ